MSQLQTLQIIYQSRSQAKTGDAKTIQLTADRNNIRRFSGEIEPYGEDETSKTGDARRPFIADKVTTSDVVNEISGMTNMVINITECVRIRGQSRLVNVSPSL